VQYETCDECFSGQLGRLLEAEIYVEAISGLGVAHNAVVDGAPMPTYWGKALGEGYELWDFSTWTPDVIVI
jgi:hypothetical protein